MFASIAKNNLPQILVATLLIDLIVLFLIRYYPGFFGKPINDWYNQFGLNAVISDVLIIVLGFLIAQYVYQAFVEPRLGWNLPVFLLLLVAIQALHDMLFYVGIIRPIPEGHNGMIDVFKAYAESGKGRVILADTGMMVGAGLLASLLASAPIHITAFVGILGAYAIPYILTTQNMYSPQ